MKKNTLLLLAFVAIAVVGAASAATAATLDVCPSGCTYGTIQTAINAAAPGDTVAVGPGTYVENIIIDRPLTLQGVGKGHHGDESEDESDHHAIIVPAASIPNPCTGSSLCGSASAASNIILVQADNVTIEGLTLDGDNPNLTSGISRGGADLDARNGIITNHALGTFNNLIVTNVTVKNVYLRGIYASSYGTFNFHDNRVTNVQGDYYSIGLFNFGGSGVMAHNKVSYANDAIASNWSMGVQFLDNEVTHSGSGVHTDNAGWSGTTADLIRGNEVKHCMTDGYGIFVFVPYLAPTVEDNEVKGCSVGLAAFGQGAPVTTQFTGNIVKGEGASNSDPSGSLGVVVSTDILGWGSTNVSASFTKNVIQHFNTGVYVEQQCELFSSYFPGDCSPGSPTQATAMLHNNIIKDSNTGANGLTGTVVDAENNWWGCNKGPNQPGCDTAIGTVDFTPWLTKPPKLHH